MKKAIIIVGVLALLGFVTFLSLRNGKDAGLEVTVEVAAKDEITAYVKATGTIKPARQVNISAKVIGEITALPVKEGDTVEKGQLLARIEEERYRSSYEQAKSRYEQLQVERRNLAVDLAESERKLKRTQELFAKGLASKEQLEQVEAQTQVARIRLAAQDLAIAQQRAMVDQAADQLDWTVVRAPMSGRIIDLAVEVGETAIPSSTNIPGSSLMVLADMTEIIAEVEVGEVDIVNIERGQEANVYVDALGDEPLVGRVTEIAVSGKQDPQAGVIRYPVKIKLSDPPANIRPGMTARARIITARAKAGIIVPLAAVQKRYLDDKGRELDDKAAPPGAKKREVVYVVRGGKARLVPVDTWIADDLNIAVTAGLDAGAEVITGPYKVLRKLKDGAAVTVKRAAGTDAADRS